MPDDLYAILEVQRGASEADIKKSYRRLARQYHPDVNKDPGAEAKFKDIQRAYAILSDTQKKAQYDQFGVTDDGPSQDYGGFDGFSGGLDDIFDAFFGGGGGRRRSHAPRAGEDLRYDLDITLQEAATGVNKDISIFHLEACHTCSGTGREAGTPKVTCPHCHGSGQIKTVQRTVLGSFSQVMTCHHCNGQGEMIKNPCKTCSGSGREKRKKTITIDIPAGVASGNKLRVTGEGNAGEPGSQPGDLYIFLTVKEHEFFRREEQDLFVEASIGVPDAILGTDLEVPTLDGKAMLKIPAGTQPGTSFRLKGKGMPSLRGRHTGDLHVRVQVTIPTQLSAKETELIEEFANLSGPKRESDSFVDYIKRWF